MKKILVIAAIFMLSVPLLFAQSSYSAGACFLYGGSRGDDIASGGIYFDTSYSYPISTLPLHHGFGMRLEALTPGFRNGTVVGITAGYSLTWDCLKGGMGDLSILLGPTLSCHMNAKAEDPARISIGGGAAVNFNLYFNEKRTTGIQLGLRGAVEGSSFHSGDMTKVRPVGWFGAGFGFTIQIDTEKDTLPSSSFRAEDQISD